MAGAMPTAAAVHHNVVHAEAIPLMMFGATIATMPAEDRETAATTKKVLMASQIVCMMVVITFAVSVLEGASYTVARVVREGALKGHLKNEDRVEDRAITV